MKKRRIISAALCLVMAAASVSAVTASVSAEEGWKEDEGAVYYLDDEGSAVTGFREIDGDTYYFLKTQDGSMAKGFKRIKGDTYYFGEDGKMRTGWRVLNGKYYYFNEDGKMQTGHLELGGKEFDFRDDGSIITTDQQIQLEWGMTKNDVKKQLKKDSFAETGNMIMTGDDARNTIYFFDADGGLILCVRSTSAGRSMDHSLKLLKASGCKCIKKTKIGDKAFYIFYDGEEYITLENLDGDTTVTYYGPEFAPLFDKDTYKELEALVAGYIADLDFSDLDLLGFDPDMLQGLMESFF
ncbi:MAG: hypothetical protein II936_05315 [Oscillospiraceae bacterium]|nr:hypothetical protein [Oscillospiraceae bacterium]